MDDPAHAAEHAEFLTTLENYHEKRGSVFDCCATAMCAY
jgi:hypothetical protein